MFISKKKYQEKLDLIDGYRKERDKAFNKIKELENRLDSRIDNEGRLIAENQKLIGWIEKIINEVGCYKVDDRRKFRIPMYETDGPAYDTEFNGDGFVVDRKIITIPEITIMHENRRI